MKLKLRGKLLLSFMAVVVLIVGLSVYSYYSMKEMGRGTDTIYSHNKEMEAAADLQLTAMDALMPVNDYLVSGDRDERANFKKLIADARSRLEDIRKGDLEENEKAVVEKIEDRLDALETAGGNILELDVQGANVSLSGRMKDFDAIGEEMEKEIEGLHEIYRGTMTETMTVVDKTEATSINILIIVSLLSILAGIGIGLYMSRAISRPLLELLGVANEVAAGDLTRRARISTSDEIGELGHAINKMVDGLKDIVGGINRTAAQCAAAADQLAKGAREVQSGAHSQAGAAEETSASMEQMAASIQTVAKNADDLASNVNETSSSITQMVTSITQVAKNAEHMSSSVSEASASIEQMTVSIDRVAKDTESLSASVEETSATVEQMMASLEQVAKNSDVLSSTVSETSATVEQMAASIQRVAQNVAEADQISQKAAVDAKDGGEAVEQTVEGIDRITRTMKTTAEVIGSLGRRSEEIGKIVEVIEDIADQTNLLALNAAIEAARAGDAGRGFAVVADEVRKLAERSVVATKEIGQVIKLVQDETNQAVKTAEAGAAETVEGKKLADKAGASLRRILESVGAASRLMSDVNIAAKEQAGAASQVLKAVGNMNQATGQVITAVKEQAMGSSQIRKAVENMNATTQQVAGAMREQAAGGRQIRTAVEAINRLTGEVSSAAREQAAGSVQIMKAVENMNGMTQQVAMATREQKRGGELVVQAVENIAGIARTNLDSSNEMAASAESISFQIESLQNSISVFKVARIDVNCWDILHCGNEFRYKCPAYQNQEKRCWLIEGTWCKGVKQGDAKSKLSNCMHCEAFKVMQGVGMLAASPARAIGDNRG